MQVSIFLVIFKATGKQSKNHGFGKKVFFSGGVSSKNNITFLSKSFCLTVFTRQAGAWKTS
jgi:hypothetical protein